MTQMAKTYAAKRLLEHGPLTMQDFVEITGWHQRQAYSAMASLIKSGVAQRKNPSRLRHTRPHYGLASSITADGFTGSTGMNQSQPSTDTRN